MSSENNEHNRKYTDDTVSNNFNNWVMWAWHATVKE